MNICTENEITGTTSNEKGEFEFELEDPKVLIFSAVGFETKKIASDLIKDTVEFNTNGKPARE